MTSNNGVDWLLLENGLEGLDVLSLAVDLDNPILSVGTSNGLHASTDRGISFHPLNDRLPNDFGLYPAVGAVCVLNNHLFIGTSAGVYKTTKSSMQWQAFNNKLPFLDVNTMLVFLNDKIYVGMNTGMYRSSVREANWEQVYDKTIHDIIMVGNELYAAGFAEPCHPVMRSSDFGDTWSHLGPGVGGCVGQAILSQGDGLWIGTSWDGMIPFSLDKGTTWQQTQIPITWNVTGLARRVLQYWLQQTFSQTTYETVVSSYGAISSRISLKPCVTRNSQLRPEIIPNLCKLKSNRKRHLLAYFTLPMGRYQMPTHAYIRGLYSPMRQRW